MDAVLYERREHIALLTLNRPEQRNSMSLELCQSFSECLAAVEPDVRALVVTGAGSCFCAGADLSRVGALDQAQLRAFYRPFLALAELEVPTIAAVQGHAVGGGLGIALLCDLRIVADDAKIGANFARLGIHPGLGISELLPQAVGYARAAELLFTGELLLGREAAAMGLCRSVPRDEVLPRALDLARRIAGAAPLAVRRIKRTLRRTVTEETLELESSAQAELMRTDDAREGFTAMLARREPSFVGR